MDGIKSGPSQPISETVSSLASRVRKAAMSAVRWDDDALSPYRARIALQLSIVGVALLLPFTVNHFFAGRWMLGAVVGVAQTALMANGLMLRLGRDAPVPFWLMVLAMALAVVGAILVQGTHGALWAAPTLFIAYFLLRRRVALVLSLLMLAGGTAAALLSEGGGPPLAARVFATLSVLLVMINVVLNVVGELQEALQAQAITDPLTGAFNRRHLVKQLGALPEPAPGTDAVNVLLAVDVDHFKSINDRHGHAAGDAVLRGLVATLRARLRPSDRLFRTGGEEFVLLLPRIGRTDASRLAEDLRRRVAEAALVPDHPERGVTVSIGVAAQCPGRDAEAWQHATDEALYEAKRRGRNCVVIAS
jgi:diguanylate cyclase (GGDEF)-like protein